jgi:hypothetical protein
MKIRLNQEIPPRVVAALGYSVFLVLCSLFVYVLGDSCRDWVSVFFVKQVARIHYHRETTYPYYKMWPSVLRESIRYEPLERKYRVTYGSGSWSSEVIINSDGTVWFPGTPSH